MPNTIGSKFGDVVLVPFPFTDQTAVKRRPALVVPLIEEWREAGLLKASLIKPVFTTVEQGGPRTHTPLRDPGF